MPGDVSGYPGHPALGYPVTPTQHKVSLKQVMEWMEHAGGVSPKEIAMKARVREGVIPSVGFARVAKHERTGTRETPQWGAPPRRKVAHM
jgi:hypothetical protein